MITLLRNWVFRDFWLKLFSFVLAVLTWLAVSLAIPKEGSPASPLMVIATERVFSNLPVIVMSSAEDVRSFKVNPKEVEVTVQGDPNILKKLQAKDIRALVDMTGIQAARDLTKRIEVSTPPGVTLVRIAPEEVQVVYPPRG